MRKETFIHSTMAVLLALFCTPAAMGQSGTNNDTDWMKDVTERIHLHAYAQGGFNYNHARGEDNATFDMKRAIFLGGAQFTDRWSFFFMHDFSSVVQEYYTDFRVTNNKALTVRIGQFKNSVSIENSLSPTIMESIDVCSEGVTYLAGCGSDPLFGVQYGRDLGLAIFGETNDSKLRYELDVMNGQGVNKKDQNKEKDFIARLEYRPIKGLNLVATGQIGHGHAAITGNNLSFANPDIMPEQNYKRNRLTAGFYYTSKAFNAHGEYIEGKDGNATSRGAYITGSIPLGNSSKWEMIGSYDFFNFNTALGLDQHKVIAGIQYWFYRSCRFQLQYVYKNAYYTPTTFTHGANHAIMAQMQVRIDYTGKKK